MPLHERGMWAQGPDTVTALAIEGDDRIYDLPQTKAAITVGSQGDRDIVLNAWSYVSRHHCTIERRGLRTYVVDAGSRFGVVVGDALVTEVEIKPGSRFLLAGRLPVVALNDAMRANLPVVGRLVCREAERRENGSQERPGPLDILAIALDTAPVLITGEAGCDHDRLARALHAISQQRMFDLSVLSTVPSDRKAQRRIIDGASRSSLILPMVDDMKPIDPPFLAMLFDRSYKVRVIALASTVAKANEILGTENVKRMTEIYLRSIAFRPSVILWQLDEVLRERGSTLRTGDMTAANRHALEAHDWLRNFDELRQVADWLVLLDKLSLRDAAEQLGIAPSTLHDHIKEIGLSVPLTRHGRALGQR